MPSQSLTIPVSASRLVSHYVAIAKDVMLQTANEKQFFQWPMSERDVICRSVFQYTQVNSLNRFRGQITNTLVHLTQCETSLYISISWSYPIYFVFSPHLHVATPTEKIVVHSPNSHPTIHHGRIPSLQTSQGSFQQRTLPPEPLLHLRQPHDMACRLFAEPTS